MGLIFLALLAGCIVGIFGKVPEKCYQHIDKLVTGTLFIMLLALGAQIGSNKELLNSLNVMGWRALVITILSISGSIALLWAVSSYIHYYYEDGGN